MSRFMSHFVIYGQIVKNPIFKSNGFCGWGQLSQVGPSRAGPTAPGPTAPGPTRARPSPCQITGPRPTWSVRFQSRRTLARPGQRVSELTGGGLPGLAREILRIFSLLLRAVSPPPRGFEAATYSLARAPRLLSGVARSLQSAYEAVCHAPIPAFRYRWFGVGYVVP